ncbi:MAG: MBL fold metallo-hydrolase [Planctomycetes bacterium]|nr:MBL fold metallo-hydrolase [Planctomycetota bacterium]
MPEPDSSRGELILLGTGTSVGVPMIGCDCAVCTSTNPKNHRTRTGVAINTPRGVFVIDTPPELRLQLVRERVRLIEAAVFTHAHADHIFGLDDLRTSGWKLSRPIPLFCEERVERQLRASFGYAFETPSQVLHPGAIPKLEFVRIGLEAFDVLGQRVQPIRLLHGQLPILGYRINDVAFCTDVSHIPEESWPLLEGLDVLILDALQDNPHPTHFSIAQSLKVVERLRPRQAFFTHVSHKLDYDATNARLPAGVELAYDGLRLPL